LGHRIKGAETRRRSWGKLDMMIARTVRGEFIGFFTAEY
jgi:hypothetical protein